VHCHILDHSSWALLEEVEVGSLLQLLRGLISRTALHLLLLTLQAPDLVLHLMREMLRMLYYPLEMLEGVALAHLQPFQATRFLLALYSNSRYMRNTSERVCDVHQHNH
jgi:hypothetical protein